MLIRVSCCKQDNYNGLLDRNQRVVTFQIKSYNIHGGMTLTSFWEKGDRESLFFSFFLVGGVGWFMLIYMGSPWWFAECV